MYTITFYSFKGGVGRTMALVNVAAQLAKMGRKVLLLDFDLEAPGLETFDRLRPAPYSLPKVERREGEGGEFFLERRDNYAGPTHPGLVEYVTEYMRTMRAPDVREFIYSASPIGNKGGQIWVMPAGRRDAEYQSALTKIDWLTLYRKHDGFLLFEDTKAQWEQEYRPDYVLIDSRTGHTDVEGICTRQLPDAVAVCFFPNEQNLAGLQEVCRRIRAEATSGLRKSIRLHFVMSNVPDLDDEHRVLRRWLKEFDWELSIDGNTTVIHRYESAMMFNQALFVLSRPRSRLAQEYRRLVRHLIAYNPTDRDGALIYLNRLWREIRGLTAINWTVPPAVLFKGSSWEYGIGGAGGDPLDQIARNFPNDEEILTQVTRCREEEKRLMTKKAVEQAPTSGSHPG
jgi:MinD-like ATPase involved in chromosome partitioning or flagellar assembly